MKIVVSKYERVYPDQFYSITIIKEDTSYFVPANIFIKVLFSSDEYVDIEEYPHFSTLPDEEIEDFIWNYYEKTGYIDNLYDYMIRATIYAKIRYFHLQSNISDRIIRSLEQYSKKLL